MNIDFGGVILDAVTAVGLIEWTKHLWKAKNTKLYAWLLPVTAAVVAFGLLWPPLRFGLQVWAVAQLAYPVLVQLPAKIAGGKE